jgi:hypothetical protein
LVEDDADPLGLLEVAELPLGPLLALALDVSGPEVPPAPGLLVPPVPLEAEPPGVVVVVVDDEDEPPGTTTVSFSFVVVEAVGPDPPGTTVVVSLRSHPESASAPTTSNT